MTLHTGEATSELLYQVLDNWNLLEKVEAVTMVNSSDVCKGIEILTNRFERGGGGGVHEYAPGGLTCSLNFTFSQLSRERVSLTGTEGDRLHSISY